MFLLRKKEIDQFYINLISSCYNIFHFDYYSFFYGEYKLEKFKPYDLDKIINSQEEIECVKILLKSNSKSIISEKHRSYISFFALLRNLAKSYVSSEIDIMSFYLLVNCHWIDEIFDESNVFWSSSLGSLSEHKKNTIFKIAINSFVSNNLNKNKTLSFKSLTCSFIPEFNDFNNLRNIYFFIKNREKLNLLKEENINFKQKYIDFFHHNKYVNNKVSIDKFFEHFYYIPEDTMVGIFQNLYDKEVLIPYSGSVMLTDKFKEVFNELCYFQGPKIIDEAKKIHYNISCNNTLINRCDSSDILKTFERICNGKMRMD